MSAINTLRLFVAQSLVRLTRFTSDDDVDDALRLLERARRANRILDDAREVIDAARALVAAGAARGASDWSRIETALARLDAAGAEEVTPCSTK